MLSKTFLRFHVFFKNNLEMAHIFHLCAKFKKMHTSKCPVQKHNMHTPYGRVQYSKISSDSNIRVSITGIYKRNWKSGIISLILHGNNGWVDFNNPTDNRGLRNYIEI